MKVRRGLVVCLILLFCLAVGAASTSAADVELTFWSWRTEDIDAYEKFIKVFEAENPGITVKFIPFKNTEYNTILATALQGGTGPDIIHLRSYGGMEALAEAGYLMELTEAECAGSGKIPQRHTKRSIKPSYRKGLRSAVRDTDHTGNLQQDNI